MQAGDAEGLKPIPSPPPPPSLSNFTMFHPSPISDLFSSSRQPSPNLDAITLMKSEA